MKKTRWVVIGFMVVCLFFIRREVVEAKKYQEFIEECREAGIVREVVIDTKMGGEYPLIVAYYCLDGRLEESKRIVVRRGFREGIIVNKMTGEVFLIKEKKGDRDGME